ncbi:unnamed protein product [Euphydryas editha]|uniref:Uncharacterized protein n=1 Tax=Euphydryas editha TaxID=104508 RepID=A0AAU9TLR4_EUPED|nr:unnamed protein product [Euphydryas editha]
MRWRCRETPPTALPSRRRPPKPRSSDAEWRRPTSPKPEPDVGQVRADPREVLDDASSGYPLQQLAYLVQQHDGPEAND